MRKDPRGTCSLLRCRSSAATHDPGVCRSLPTKELSFDHDPGACRSLPTKELSFDHDPGACRSLPTKKMVEAQLRPSLRSDISFCRLGLKMGTVVRLEKGRGSIADCREHVTCTLARRPTCMGIVIASIYGDVIAESRSCMGGTNFTTGSEPPPWQRAKHESK